VEKNGDLLITEMHGQRIRKMKVGGGAGYGTLKVSTAKIFMAANNSSSGSGNQNNSTTPTKPATPSFSLVNFVGNKVNIAVNIGSSAATRPDKVYLVAPKLGITAANPLAGVISGSTATWSVDFDKVLSGTAIPLEVVGEKDGVKSEPLAGSYEAPALAIEAKSVPAAPTNFKSRIVGSSALITATAKVKAGAIATGAYIYSKALGIPKSAAIEGDVAGTKVILEIPLQAKMAGKRYPVTIYLSNSKGESKPLEATLVIPAAPKTPTIPTAIPNPQPPQTILCVRGNQNRTFIGSKCPPGWTN
jgi:hypothetical protein